MLTCIEDNLEFWQSVACTWHAA